MRAVPQGLLPHPVRPVHGLRQPAVRLPGTALGRRHRAALRHARLLHHHRGGQPQLVLCGEASQWWAPLSAGCVLSCLVLQLFHTPGWLCAWPAGRVQRRSSSAFPGPPPLVPPRPGAAGGSGLGRAGSAAAFASTSACARRRAYWRFGFKLRQQVVWLINQQVRRGPRGSECEAACPTELGGRAAAAVCALAQPGGMQLLPSPRRCCCCYVWLPCGPCRCWTPLNTTSTSTRQQARWAGGGRGLVTAASSSRAAPAHRPCVHTRLGLGYGGKSPFA